MISTILYEFSRIALTTCTLLILYAYFIKPYLERQSVPAGKKRVPQVEGCLPIIGHGFKYLNNPSGFMKTCYEKYGEVFQINIFSKKIIVICDRNLVMTCLKENESIQKDPSIDWIFFEPGLLASKGAMNMIMRSLSFSNKQNCLVSKIEEEVGNAVHRLKSFCKNGIYTSISDTKMIDCLAESSFACFSPIELNEIVSEDLKRLSRFSNSVHMANLLIPRWILKPSVDWRIRQLRRALVPHFTQEIQKYRNDPNKSDTKFIRIAVDCQEKFTNTQIAQLVIGSLYQTIGSGNVSNVLTNVLTNLYRPENVAKLEKVRKECQECEGDVSKILRAPLLNGFIMETVRLSSAPLAIHKIVVDRQCCLGDYFIGTNISQLALSPLMLQVYGNASEVYHNPTEFIPERFTGSEAEPQIWASVLTWSGGAHFCPARRFVINQIKIIVSQLLLHFDFRIESNYKLGTLNFLTSVIFGQSTVKFEIAERKIHDEEIRNTTAEEKNLTI